MHAKLQRKSKAHPKVYLSKEISAAAATKERDKAWEAGSAFASLDLFEEDGEKAHYEALENGKRFNLFATEIRDCFGHTFLEILHQPENMASLPKHIAALEQLLVTAESTGTMSTFTFSPAGDSIFATLLSALNFKRTGFIQQGMIVGGEAQDVFVWARKNTAEEPD